MATKLSPKQEETAEVIYQLTNQFHYPPTLDEIAAQMGITKGTLQYHMTALRKKLAVTWNTGSARSVQISDQEVLGHCRAKFPEISKADKFNGNFDSRSIEAGAPEFSVERSQIPILGKIAAGVPLDVMEKANDFLELDTYFSEGCYALRVKGQSMIDALISDGDLVLIEPRDTAHNGEIVVALINDEAATLKRYYKEDGRIRLQPENPTMEPIYIDPNLDDIKIQGIVKGVVRKT
ncbi:MAG: repressor LexA [Candidatus Melainabacteria bacterium]|jgi:repressor LexA|nr:repressor LexA [Candidatus Melainabacteria bacterium]